MLPNLGKCQSVHFSAQIASFSLTMMQYRSNLFALLAKNILCTVKRFEAYETLGGTLQRDHRKYSRVVRHGQDMGTDTGYHPGDSRDCLC